MCSTSFSIFFFGPPRAAASSWFGSAKWSSIARLW